MQPSHAVRSPTAYLGPQLLPEGGGNLEPMGASCQVRQISASTEMLNPISWLPHASSQLSNLSQLQEQRQDFAHHPEVLNPKCSPARALQCSQGCTGVNSSSNSAAPREMSCLKPAVLCCFFVVVWVVLGFFFPLFGVNLERKRGGLHLSSGFVFGGLLMKFCITQAKSPVLLLSSRLSPFSPAEH